MFFEAFSFQVGEPRPKKAPSGDGLDHQREAGDALILLDIAVLKVDDGLNNGQVVGGLEKKALLFLAGNQTYY